MVVPVDFQGTNHTVSVEALRSLVFTEMNQFARDNSFGSAYVVGDVLNWTRLPRGIDYYGSDTNQVDDRDFDGIPDSWKMLDDAVKILDAKVRFGDYDYFLVVHAGHGQESSRNPLDIWSVAFLGGLYIKTSTKGINRFAIVPETQARGAVPFGVFAHEFSHLLGLPDLYDPLTRFNYMGMWSLMDRGGWNGDPPGSSPSHVEGWGKQKLGWVPSERTTFVNASMALNVTLDPLELPSSGTQLIRIPVKDSRFPKYFLVETRTQTGYDQALPQSGVIITYIDEGDSRGKVRLQDATPNTDTYTDAAWQVGQTFLDSPDGITITVTAKTGDSYVVFVNRLGPISELEVESLTPQTNEIHPGDTVQLFLTVRNKGSLDASKFNVNVYINGTLYSTQTISLGAGKSSQITITWTAQEGIYEFKILVDPENKITEATKSNNQMTLTLTVGFIISIELPLPANVLGADVGWWIKVNGVTYNFKGPGTFTLSVTNGPQIVEAQPVIDTALGSRLVFTGWADGESSNPRTLTVTADMSLTPTYTSQYLVTVNSNGGEVNGGGWFDSGSQTTANAVSPSGVVEKQSRLLFAGWSGDVSSTEPQLVVLVDRALTIVANWKTQYYVTITSAFGEVPGSGWYDANSQIQLSVSTIIDHANGTRRIFLGWGGDIASTEPTISLFIDGPKTVASNWKTQYELRIESTHGNPSGAGWYDSGAQANFSIEAVIQVDSGTRYVFVKWTGDPGSDSPSGTVVMNSAMEMQAEWKTQYYVTFMVRGLQNQTQLTIRVNDSDYTIETPGSASDWFDERAELSPSTNSTLKVRLIQYSLLRWENSRGETVKPPFAVMGPETYVAVYSGSVSPPGCFIATATYGSEVADEVQLLRDFRDGTVAKTSAGAAFMYAFNAWYYSFSPQIAAYVAQSDGVKAPLRIVLYPLIGALLVTSRVHDVFAFNTELAVIVSGLVASSLLGLVYLTPLSLVAAWRSRRARRMLSPALKALIAFTLAGLVGLVAGEVASASTLLVIGSALFVLGILMLTPVAIASRCVKHFEQ